MDAQKKLDFVLKMTKHALEHVQHFDSGGLIVQGGPAAPAPTPSNIVTAGGAPAAPTSATLGGPQQAGAGYQGTYDANNYASNNAAQTKIEQQNAMRAPIQAGTNSVQLNNAYTGAQNALQGAGNLAGTLTPGVSQGVGTQGYLTNQLVNQSQGIGYNPAQAALNQNTGQNIAQQAALAASVRGAGSNAGLIAQQNAAQGAATQQQAVGQGATLQAQQALNAQSQLGNLAAQQVGQGTTATQLQNQTQQNEQNILQGANTAFNNAQVSQQQNINSTNEAMYQANLQNQQATNAGVGQALGSAAAALPLLFNEGGEVPAHIKMMASIYHPHLAQGGEVWQNSTPDLGSINAGASVNAPSAAPTSFGQGFANGFKPQFKAPGAPSDESVLATGAQEEEGDMTPGELNPYASPTIGAAPMGLTPDMAKGGKVKNFEPGGKVPGKAKVNHNAYKNDTVSAKLSPGEVVIDLNTLKDKGKLGQMARFVANNIERKKAGRALK